MRAVWVLALTANIAVLSGAQALGQQPCKPTMTFIEARYSAMQLPKLQRTWTAVLSVDASHCQTLSGRFEIVYSMEKGERARLRSPGGTDVVTRLDESLQRVLD